MSDGAATLPRIPMRPMRGKVYVLLDLPDGWLSREAGLVLPDPYQPTSGIVLRVGLEDERAPHGLREGDHVQVGKWNGRPIPIKVAQRYGIEPISTIEGLSPRLYEMRPLANGKGDGDHVHGVLSDG